MVIVPSEIIRNQSQSIEFHYISGCSRAIKQPLFPETVSRVVYLIVLYGPMEIMVLEGEHPDNDSNTLMQ